MSCGFYDQIFNPNPQNVLGWNRSFFLILGEISAKTTHSSISVESEHVSSSKDAVTRDQNVQFLLAAYLEKLIVMTCTCVTN